MPAGQHAAKAALEAVCMPFEEMRLLRIWPPRCIPPLGMIFHQADDGVLMLNVPKVPANRGEQLPLCFVSRLELTKVIRHECAQCAAGHRIGEAIAGPPMLVSHCLRI
jgi:hypothetical protein